MQGQLLIAGILCVAACGAEIPIPSEFYIVSEFFSDNGAAFYYRLVEVRAIGPDTLVRYSRVAPENPYCRRLVVQSAEKRIQNTSPGDLIKTSNPCAIAPGKLNAAVKKYSRTAGVFEAVSFGIVAQCGSSSFVLPLPMSQKVDLKRLESANADMARLWDLSSKIVEPAFGGNDIFHDRTDEDDLMLQRAGNGIVPELVSGRYDAGLVAAVSGNVGAWESPSFRSLLAGYRGPVSATESGVVPQLVNPQAFQFIRFVAPKYPPIALIARLKGRVELKLTVDPTTGDVLDASAISGIPLLKAPAIDAAKNWRFAPGTIASKTVSLALDFSFSCP